MIGMIGITGMIAAKLIEAAVLYWLSEILIS